MIYPPERHPPYAPEAEISVLGGMLCDNDAVPKAMEVLDDSMFYDTKNRLIYRAMIALFNRSVVVDPITIAEILKDEQTLERAGGLAYLSELLDAVPTAANIAYHAAIVRDRAVRRRMIEVCGEAITKAHQPDGIETDALAEEVQSKLFSVCMAGHDGKLVWLNQSLMGTFARIEEVQGTNGLTGVPSGLVDLDELTGGWQKSDLVLVAARPAMGKTALVTGTALHAAIHAKVPVAVFSLEMSRDQLNQRMLASEALVDLGRIVRGGLVDDDYVRLSSAAALLNHAPICVDDRGGVDLTYIRARARRMKAERPDLGLIIVDYIQLVHGQGENENIRVGSVSRGLKELAKELAVPVLALSQITRENTKRADKRPQLSDLRDSGSLEQDADIVIFLHRPEYYLSPAEAMKDGLLGKTEVIVSKHRNGPTGMIDVFFRKESARFESFARWSA